MGIFTATLFKIVKTGNSNVYQSKSSIGLGTVNCILGQMYYTSCAAAKKGKEPHIH